VLDTPDKRDYDDFHENELSHTSVAYSIVRPITIYDWIIAKPSLDASAFSWHARQVRCLAFVPVRRLHLDHSPSWFEHQTDLRLGILGIAHAVVVSDYFETVGS
jgi:hypothetical protein